MAPRDQYLFGSLWTVDDSSSLEHIVCVLSEVWREEGLPWVGGSPVHFEPELATAGDFLVAAEESTVGSDFAVVLDRPLVLSAEQLGESLGQIDERVQQLLEKSLDEGVPEERAGTATVSTSGLMEAQRRRDAFANEIQNRWAEVVLDDMGAPEPETIAGGPDMRAWIEQWKEIKRTLGSQLRAGMANLGGAPVLAAAGSATAMRSAPGEDVLVFRGGLDGTLRRRSDGRLVLDLSGLPEKETRHPVRVLFPLAGNAPVNWESRTPGLVEGELQGNWLELTLGTSDAPLDELASALKEVVVLDDVWQ